MIAPRHGGSASAVPAHVAIIMDGNGRWATRRGQPRSAGHVRGARTARRVIAHCARRGVAQLTLYAFSSDNWSRPAREVELLLALFTSHITRAVASLCTHGIRVSVIGRRDRLPAALLAAIEEAEVATSAGRRMHLRVAIDYSSRGALQRALAVSDRLRGAWPSDTILPPVDLLLRTGGERRLSDFLLWESAYAELAFLDVPFPDLSAEALDAVFADFASRHRRFGGLTTPELV